MTQGQKWVASVSLPQPTLDNNTADVDRLLECLTREVNQSFKDPDLDVIQNLSGLLRKGDFQVRCSFFQAKHSMELTGLSLVSDKKNPLGLALDLGTTKYALSLIDLETAAVKSEISRDNPQISIGADILTRIHYCERKNAVNELQAMLIEDINKGIGKLCSETGKDLSCITNVAAAGNTTMSHLFLGLNPYWMIREPYIPVINDPDLIKASELGIRIHPQARILCLPNIGSYFGGDLLAGILYSEMHESHEICLFVDVGTNAEVVLGNKDWMVACAGAAGPALEEGMSRIGKQAGPGIIDRVRIDPQTLHFEVHAIEEISPRGVCGSGFIDLAAQLFLSGLLDFRGKFVPERCPDCFREIDGIVHLVLVSAQKSGTGEELLIGQPEIDSLIRSKAAMFTILETLMLSVGLGFEDVSKFYVAGTFGNFINPSSAISIGMLPDLPLENYLPLGNSSLGGAVRILQDRTAVREIRNIKKKLTYLELNVNQEFMNRFSAAKFLPHTDRNRFPSVRV